MTYRLGLIINPIAGMGGSVGLKGTDGQLVEKALELGAVPVAEDRAVTALSELREFGDTLHVLTCDGAMGATAVEKSGLNSTIVSGSIGRRTRAKDTQTAARDLMKHDPALLLFVGGDGTGRDLLEVVQQKIPVLGVPSGVKMHSAIFGTSARAAGQVVKRYLRSEKRSSLLAEAEILDREERGPDNIELSPSLYGMMLTPRFELLVSQAKASSAISEQAALNWAIKRTSKLLFDDKISLVGPGSTMQSLKRELGCEGTSLGVDAFKGGQLISKDINEQDILELIDRRPSRIIISIVGGQGFLFGRGNQQLSARVIREVGIKNISIISSMEKLAGLSSNCLLVDTGDEDLDDSIGGHIPVLVSGKRTVIMPVKNSLGVAGR